jgi:hypothetical protein
VSSLSETQLQTNQNIQTSNTVEVHTPSPSQAISSSQPLQHVSHNSSTQTTSIFAQDFNPTALDNEFGLGVLEQLFSGLHVALQVPPLSSTDASSKPQPDNAAQSRYFWNFPPQQQQQQHHHHQQQQQQQQPQPQSQSHYLQAQLMQQQNALNSVQPPLNQYYAQGAQGRRFEPFHDPAIVASSIGQSTQHGQNNTGFDDLKFDVSWAHSLLDEDSASSGLSSPIRPVNRNTEASYSSGYMNHRQSQDYTSKGSVFLVFLVFIFCHAHV